MQQLLDIMARLRDKEKGCPWDVEQDFKSIAPYTLEEAYEVVDAIEKQDMGALREELGDLLLQVVFHSQMASEEKIFDFNDVVEAVCDKLVRRHPHVFGEAEIKTAEAQTASWEAIKAGERAGKAKDEPVSILDDVPHAFPALLRAMKLQKRAAKVGFDWGALEPIFDKLQEETAELRYEIETDAPMTALTDEMGDILFVCVNLARQIGVDPEEALRATNRKFERRFRHVENMLRNEPGGLEAATLEQMDALWNEAKAQEKAGAE